jgi:hypothetical protein
VTVRRLLVIIAAALVLVGAGVLAWKIFFPDEKARIVRTLRDAAEAVAIDRADSAATMLIKTHRLETLLDDTVDVSLRANRESVSGSLERRNIISMLAAARRSGVAMSGKLSDFSVAIDGDRAHVEAAASIRYRRQGDQEFLQQEDLDIELVRRDGNWLITKVAIRNFMEK